LIIDNYKRNVQKYYRTLIYYKYLNNINYVEIYPLLKDKISNSSKFIVFLKIIKHKFISLIPDKLKTIIKSYLFEK